MKAHIRDYKPAHPEEKPAPVMVHPQAEETPPPEKKKTAKEKTAGRGALQQNRARSLLLQLKLARPRLLRRQNNRQNPPNGPRPSMRALGRRRIFE